MNIQLYETSFYNNSIIVFTLGKKYMLKIKETWFSLCLENKVDKELIYKSEILARKHNPKN